MDPSFRYATVRYDTDGVETDWDISFSGGYISQSHVGAYSVLKSEVPGLGLDRQEHSLTFVSEGPSSSTIRISPAVADERTLTIYRDTPKTGLLVDFVDGRVMNRANLDLAHRQAIFGLAELLDAVLDANLTIGVQTDSIISISELVQQVYDATLEILAASGIVSVLPKVWSFTATEGQTEFELDGADLQNSGFYDTYAGGSGLVPDVDFSVTANPLDATGRLLTLSSGVTAGTTVFTVLRGFARPYIGEPPVTDLREPVFFRTTAQIIDRTYARGVIATTSAAPLTHSIKEIPSVATSTSMRTGDKFHVIQRDVGRITLAPETGEVTITSPSGYLAATRAQGSHITAFCLDAGTNEWTVTGDLALST